MVESCCQCEIGMFVDPGVAGLVCGGNTLWVTGYISLGGGGTVTYVVQDR